jgi:hypothetical protein
VKKKLLSGLRVLPAAFLLTGAAIFTSAQDQPGNKQNARPGQTPQSNSKPEIKPDTNAEKTTYTYEFSQPKFNVNHIVIEHDQTGRGTITFERINEAVPIVDPLQLSPAALARILGLWEALRFLDSDTDYQSSQHFAHLGVMRIGMQRGERKRVAEFDWTHNRAASDLVSEYRRAADQAILVFDIALARQNQPLNAPKLMELLESYLRRNAISDPQQLVPLLTELSTDEHVPLIARNHALRLIKKIQK